MGVAFRVTARMENKNEGAQIKAQLFMIDPTPIGSKLTVCWNASFIRRVHNVHQNHVEIQNDGGKWKISPLNFFSNKN